MDNFSMDKTLNNGNIVSLYMDVYGINYIVSVFTCDYKVLHTRKTQDYFLALHYITIFENKYSK